MRILHSLLLATLLLIPLSSCSVIDDDLSQCANTYSIDYNLHVVTNIDMQINTQLNMETDLNARNFLSNYYQQLLQPAVSNVDLGFYDANTGDMRRAYYRQMTGTTANFAIELPATNYRHLASVGHTAGQSEVHLADTDLVTSSKLIQEQGDTIYGHQLPILTGRLDMNVLGNVEQSFNVNLYPADANVALIATVKNGVRDVRVFLTDLANSFTINDSTWQFNVNPMIRTLRVPVTNTTDSAYLVTVFPSRPSATRADGDDAAAQGSVWRAIVMAQLSDGSVTRSVLYVRTPLKAGDVRVLRITVDANGAAITKAADVGASVTLNWNKGGEYNPDI